MRVPRSGRMLARRSASPRLHLEDRMRRRAGVLVVLCGFAVATMVAQRGAPLGQWPTYGGDFGSSKYSALDQITRDNAQRLKVVWRWESVDNQVVKDNRRALPAFPAAFKSTPIMVNG